MDIIHVPMVDLRKPQISLCHMDAKYAEIISKHNVYIIGDLHGNFVKLLSVLLHFGFITYKDLNFHDDVVNLSDDLLHDKPLDFFSGSGAEAQKFIIDFLNARFRIRHQSFVFLVFLGDIYCDRGPSDFVTFCVFEWMRSCRFRFQLTYGNHELVLGTGEAFSDHPNVNFFKFEALRAPRPYHSYYRSFDFPKFNPSCREVFCEMYKKCIDETVLFSVFFEKGRTQPFFLTHAPASNVLFNAVLDAFESATLIEIGDVFQKSAVDDKSFDVNVDHFHKYIRCILLRSITPLGMRTLSPAEIRVFEAVSSFCNNREYTDPVFYEDIPSPYSRVPSFLVSSPKQAFKYELPPMAGVNIFGHMASPMAMGTLVGIDSPTGMPAAPPGQVVYACLDV